jgi:hypothetical protein
MFIDQIDKVRYKYISPQNSDRKNIYVILFAFGDFLVVKYLCIS